MLVLAVTGAMLAILYRFIAYDRQVMALIRHQQNFDLAWGDLKRRRVVSKGNYPFFRQWGVKLGEQIHSMDELSKILGWNFFDDFARDMNTMKERGNNFIAVDKTVISPSDGKPKYYRCHMNRLSHRRFTTCIQDITWQRNWENTLLEREKYLNAIIETSDDGIIAISDVDGKSHVNSRFIEMFDAGDPEEFRKNVSTEQFFELHRKLMPDWEEIGNARLRAVEMQQPQSGMFRLYDGRIFDWHVVPVHLGPGGQTDLTCIWMYRDITERFKTAATIQKSELKFRAIFNSSAGGLALFDVVHGSPVDFRYADVNPAWEKIHGKTKDELIDRSLIDFFSNSKIVSEKLAGESVLPPCLLAMKGEPGTYTIRFGKAGVYHNITVFRTETDQLAIFVTDDTARIKDERALRTMRTVIDHLPEPVVWLTREGIIRYINKAGSNAVGFERSDLIFGSKIWRFDTSILSEENWQDLLEKLDNEENLQFETILKRKDGTLFPAAVVINRIEHDGHLFPRFERIAPAPRSGEDGRGKITLPRPHEPRNPDAAQRHDRSDQSAFGHGAHGAAKKICRSGSFRQQATA